MIIKNCIKYLNFYFIFNNAQIEEVDVLAPEHQAVAHRLGIFWFRLSQVKVLDKNEEDETLVDGFVFSWSYLQVCVCVCVVNIGATGGRGKGGGVCWLVLFRHTSLPP